MPQGPVFFWERTAHRTHASAVIRSHVFRALAKVMLLSGLLFGSCQFAEAQRLPSLDSVKALLTDMTLQIEITSGVDDLYNFKFKRAESQFRWLQRNYPTHPLPYFLLGLVEWWKIQPDVEVTAYDESFYVFMDSSILLAERMYKENSENLEAPFFLAAAHAFKGRLLSERSSWTKAAFEGKRSLKYLEISKQHQDLSPELLFGDGLYNYFSVWIPENYPMLKPLLIFFAKGDKQLGIDQLETVRKDAFYAKVEAMYFLMRIYSVEESQPFKALQIAEYLNLKYPDNPYFHRYYARMLYSLSNYPVLETVCRDILQKVERKEPGYEANTGRYAAFFMAAVARVLHKDKEMAKKYLRMAVDFAKANKTLDSGYSLFALASLGRMASDEKRMEEAMGWYDLVLEHADRKHSTHKEARDFRKDYRKTARKRK